MRRQKAEDRDLWRRAMRDVRPLAGRAPPPPRLDREDRPVPATEDAERHQIPLPPRAPPLPPLDRHAGIDKATAERLRRGRYPVEATLDLHGMTQDEAHRALSRFIAGSRAAGRRCLLVVTGRGRASGGILRHAVPRWLDEPPVRPHLLLTAPARPQHGGHGALYLLLRRQDR